MIKFINVNSSTQAAADKTCAGKNMLKTNVNGVSQNP